MYSAKVNGYPFIPWRSNTSMLMCARKTGHGLGERPQLVCLREATAAGPRIEPWQAFHDAALSMEHPRAGSEGL